MIEIAGYVSLCFFVMLILTEICKRIFLAGVKRGVREVYNGRFEMTVTIVDGVKQSTDRSGNVINFQDYRKK